MKISSLLSSLLLTLLTFNSSVNAQTPDGATPANEGICDPLREGGISKGLYGLCVAFCEAQDIVSETDPVTEAELDTILANVPSSRILTNYNRKKQSSDPGMPCIVEASACPCWSNAEIAEIDGVFDAISIDHATVRDNDVNISHSEGVYPSTLSIAKIINPNAPESRNICFYQNYQDSAMIVQRIDTLNEVQASACVDSINQHLAGE